MAYPMYILAGLAHVMMPIPVRARVASMGDGSSRIDTRYWYHLLVDIKFLP